MVKSLECSPSTSEVTGSNLGLGTSCWKVGSVTTTVIVVF